MRGLPKEAGMQGIREDLILDFKEPKENVNQQYRMERKGIPLLAGVLWEEKALRASVD